MEDLGPERHPLSEYIEAHPDCGVQLVGQARDNSDDLPELVRQSGAAVVLVDLKLDSYSFEHPSRSPDRYNGLLACKRLKSTLPNVTVAAYTQHPSLRKDAKEHQADRFILRTSDRLLVEALRNIHDEPPPDPPPPPVDDIVKFELVPPKLLLSIELKNAATPVVDRKLSGVGFALLWYLTEERLRHGHGWLQLVHFRDKGVSESKWQITKPGRWSEISGLCGTEWSAYEHLDLNSCDSWRNQVNDKLKGRIDGHILQTSAKGPVRFGEVRVTLLHPRIRPEAVVIRSRS